MFLYGLYKSILVKNAFVLLLLALQTQIAFSQTDKEKEQYFKEILQQKIDGPLKQLNGSWNLYSLALGGKTYLTQNLQKHADEAFKESVFHTKKTLSAADSLALNNRINEVFKNTLLLNFSFTARSYFFTKNGITENGSLSFNDDKTRLYLYPDFQSDRKRTYRIDQLDDKQLVLVAIDDYRRPGEPHQEKEMAKLTFYKKGK